jgi:hypothetical protein
MVVYPVCCQMEVVGEVPLNLKIMYAAMFLAQSMETGDHGLATVNVTLLVVAETDREHVYV